MSFKNSNRKRQIRIVGVILIITWVSQIPYLFPHPFQEIKGIRDLAADFMKTPNWIKQQTSINAQTADELYRRIVTGIRIDWIKSAVFIVIGVLSGWLLIQQRKAGYLLAFFFSLFIIGTRFVDFWQYRRVIFGTYGFMLRHVPVTTIHDILTLIVLLGTVIFLTYVFAKRELDGISEQTGASRLN